jgi:hypothetical protein
MGGLAFGLGVERWGRTEYGGADDYEDGDDLRGAFVEYESAVALPQSY